MTSAGAAHCSGDAATDSASSGEGLCKTGGGWLVDGGREFLVHQGFQDMTGQGPSHGGSPAHERLDQMIFGGPLQVLWLLQDVKSRVCAHF